MNKIPKCKTKVIVIPQRPQYLKVNKKGIIKEKDIPQKIVQKKLKINSNIRQFGRDITITLKNSKNEEFPKSTKNTINTNKVNNSYNIFILLIFRLKYI